VINQSAFSVYFISVIESVTDRVERNQRLCTFFAERGHCQRGVKCKFQHGNPQTRPLAPVADPKPRGSKEKVENHNGNIASLLVFLLYTIDVDRCLCFQTRPPISQCGTF
jgi:hypothetical protein